MAIIETHRPGTALPAGSTSTSTPTRRTTALPGSCRRTSWTRRSTRSQRRRPKGAAGQQPHRQRARGRPRPGLPAWVAGGDAASQRSSGNAADAERFYEPIQPEYHDKDARLRQLDEQQIEQTIMYPGGWALLAEAYLDGIDPLYDNIDSFNRWIDEDWGFAYKDRIYAPAMLSMRDLDRACAELDRVLAAGARFILLPAGPAYGRIPGDPYFDPFWARDQRGQSRRRLPHLASSTTRRTWPRTGAGSLAPPFQFSAWQWQNTYGERPITDTLSALIFDNLFGRFPNIKVLVSEFGAEWVPHFIRHMDKSRGMGRNGPWLGGQLTERPSTIFNNHIRVVPYPEDDTDRAGRPARHRRAARHGLGLAARRGPARAGRLLRAPRAWARRPGASSCATTASPCWPAEKTTLRTADHATHDLRTRARRLPPDRPHLLREGVRSRTSRSGRRRAWPTGRPGSRRASRACWAGSCPRSTAAPASRTSASTRSSARSSTAPGSTGIGLGVQNDILAPYFTHLATDEQKARWLPGLVSGELITAIAMSEPGAGSDLAAVRTTAAPRGRPLRRQRRQDLHQQRHPRRPRARGREDRPVGGAQGHQPHRRRARHGRASPAAASSTRSARSPPTPPSCSSTTSTCRSTNLIGEENRGFYHLMRNLPAERLGIAVHAVSQARRALMLTREYASERKAFGSPIGTFQVNRHALAEMKTKLESCRSTSTAASPRSTTAS